ncbi:MAG: hypothetical protein KIS73_09495 [Enhydrobacter sp.]|nr:hypothetical protein [Enhydrobacter sp.]
MKPPIVLCVLAIAAGVAVAPASVTSADAQVLPNSIIGDRDRDGVPNVFDPTNNNRRPQAWRDKDHDGIPNAYDRNSNNYRQQAWGDRDRDNVPNRYDTDRDGDGVPNQWDRNAGNPYRR